MKNDDNYYTRIMFNVITNTKKKLSAQHLLTKNK